MKSRIAPYGNEDEEKANLKTGSSQCAPTGIRIFLSISTIKKWPLSKIKFTSAFLQTGAAKCDVYVVPPREFRCKSFYLLLLTSSYGLVDANAKWQEQCDLLFLNAIITFSSHIFLHNIPKIPQKPKVI